MNSWQATSIPRTVGWHEFRYHVSPAGIDYYIDDVFVRHSGHMTWIDGVYLACGNHGYGYELGTAYFDDVEVRRVEAPPSAAKGRAFITAGNQVMVFDLETRDRLATLDLGLYSQRLALNPAGTRLYVVHHTHLPNSISVINTETNTVIDTIVGPSPIAVTVSPDGSRLYVAEESHDSVSVYDTTDHELICTVDVGSGPRDVTLNTDGSILYVINEMSSSVSVIDTARCEVTDTAPLGSRPDGGDLDPEDAFFYAANQLSNTVSVIDTDTNDALPQITVGSFPMEVALTPDGTRAFVTNRQSNNVTVIDTAARQVIDTIVVGSSPNGLEVTPDGSEVWVADNHSATISVIDTSTGAKIATLPSEQYPRYLAMGRIDRAPTAVATAAPNPCHEGQTVTLDGTGSIDPDGDALIYYWLQLDEPQVLLDLTDPARPTFEAPFVPMGGRSLSFQLSVSDGLRFSEPAVVTVTVKNINHPPEACAGDDQTLMEGARVFLDSGCSWDPDGESLAHDWVQIEGPTVDLNEADTPQPWFDAPYVGRDGATLVFQVTVSDGEAETSDTVTVLVEDVNHAPTADAGTPQTVDEGSPVRLDGCGSDDPDNDPLTWIWLQTGGTSVVLSNDDTCQPTFIAPWVGPGGEDLRFRLVVDDGLASSEPDEVTITVQNVNDPPACHLAWASKTTLWPPNHKMIKIQILGVADPNSDAVTIEVRSVTQDEPINGLGDGDTSPDAQFFGDDLVLRSERSGLGNGRVYRVVFDATDEHGASCTGAVTVCVPLSRSDPSCVDDGQHHES